MGGRNSDIFVGVVGGGVDFVGVLMSVVVGIATVVDGGRIRRRRGEIF